ncbi:LytR/AlgR family response regulator transcription factor [Spirosoma sp. KNUC1025]|uniref:LytR/AlgR family response regulator transcription factor n=1 Tax=Spirosoma sp. KNUC1025 TaxID=2894082 RepID=UPI0038640FEE
MTILIIEDEEPTARKLQRLLTDVMPSAHIAGMTVSVEESVEWLSINPRPDLIFMDIELADGQSFDIFNRFAVKSPVIFTTAYDEYAIKAFKVNSIDYLLKPVKEADLRQALEKLRHLKDVLPDSPTETPVSTLEASIENLLRQLQSANPASLPSAHSPSAQNLRTRPAEGFRDRFLIKQGQRLFPVQTDEIAYFFREINCRS